MRPVIKTGLSLLGWPGFFIKMSVIMARELSKCRAEQRQLIMLAGGLTY